MKSASTSLTVVLFCICLAGCDDLLDRAGALLGLDDSELELSEAGESAASPSTREDPSPKTRPQPSHELDAAPVVLDGLLRCVLAVSFPVQIGMRRYRSSADKTQLENGQQIAPPPEMEIEIETCLRGLDDHVAAPCGQSLADARDSYSAALSDLAPLLAMLSAYYRGLKYMDDGMQTAVSLDQRSREKHDLFALRDRVLRSHLRQALWQDWQRRARELRDRPRQRLTWQTASLVLASLELVVPVQQEDPVVAKRLLQALGVREKAFGTFVLKDLNRDTETPERVASARRLGAGVIKLREQARRLLGRSDKWSVGAGAVEQSAFEVARLAAELR